LGYCTPQLYCCTSVVSLSCTCCTSVVYLSCTVVLLSCIVNSRAVLILSGSVTTNLTTNLTLHYFLSLAAIYSQSCADRASAAFYVCMYVYCKELYSLQYVFMYLLQFSWVWEVDVEVEFEVEFEVKSAQFDLRSDQLYCCTAVGLLIELRFELKSLTFDQVLTGIWRNLENSIKNR